jgi:hypothetical protein
MAIPIHKDDIKNHLNRKYSESRCGKKGHPQIDICGCGQPDHYGSRDKDHHAQQSPVTIELFFKIEINEPACAKTEAKMDEFWNNVIFKI